MAGLIAAALAWVGNILIVKRWGESGVIWIVPVFEELAKTMTALLLGGSISFVHGVFGLIEAVHDYTSSGRLGLWTALAGLTSHWVFGQVTYYTIIYTRLWMAGIVAAALLHTYFNYIMIRFFNSDRY
ncbi:MAG: hypothetical protein CVU87_03485 [Firmicutes bacterium HGW-Firmicutes-12]|jgi:hypothetical protein|nr:MAG: hypothetical protein CVU87_03485 [Firmicutes bacterium HGW-Firmicutes-12]